MRYFPARDPPAPASHTLRHWTSRRRAPHPCRRMRMRLSLGLAAMLLGGCAALTPPPTTSGIPLPDRMSATDPARSVEWPDPAWWRGFGAPELDGLMAEA